MDSSDDKCRLFGRQRPLHDLLGGGIVADVMLWRRKSVAIGLLSGAIASWMLFYCVPGYTLLSFVSRVLMILLTVLFVWAKAAQVLKRSPPQVPLMNIPEEAMNEAAAAVGSCMNKMLQGFEDIALGKDSKLFYKVASVLLVTSILGSWTDLITLAYTSLVIALTIPALVEKSEERIARFFKQGSADVDAWRQLFKECHSKIKNWILEAKKMS